LDGVVSPQLLAGLIYFGSGLGAALMDIITPRNVIDKGTPLIKTDTPWMVGTIVFGGIVGPILLLRGLTQVPASNASLLLNTEVIMTILFAWIVFHEQLNPRFGLGTCAVLIGSILIYWNGVQAITSIVGSLAIVGTCFCWALDNNLMRVISHRNPFQITSIRGFVGGSVNILVGLWLAGSWTTLGVLSGLVIGIFCFGFSNVLWVMALRHLGSARAGTYYSSAPFIGAVVSVLLLHEPVTIFLAVASLFMAIGVLLLATERGHKQPSEQQDAGNASAMSKGG
jgi:drug/metabolite transporter (DMT)-like permease